MKPRTWLLASLAVLIACDAMVDPVVPTELNILAGNGVADTVARAMGTPLVVETRNQYGEPLPGMALRWVVREGDARVEPNGSATDDAGTASAGVVLGEQAGAVVVEAGVGDALTATFELEALPDRPARIDPAVDTVAFVALADRQTLDLDVYDPYGNRIPEPPLALEVADSSIARVDGAVIESRTPGTTTLTVVSDTASITLPLVVIQAPDSIAVTPGDTLLTALGEAVQLSARAFDRNGFGIEGAGFDWVSQDTLVAAVDGDGLVTSRGPGEALVAAEAGGASGSARIVVDQVAERIEIAPDSATITALEDTARFVATAYDRNDYEIVAATFDWTSSDAAVADVDAGGIVTARLPGRVEIEASADGVTAGAVAIVRQLADVIELSPADTTVTAIADTVHLRGTARDRNGFDIEDATFTWTTSAPEVATTVGDGTVISKGQGVAEITATRDSASAVARVEVEQVADTLEIEPTAFTLVSVGDTRQLAAIARDRNGYAIGDAAFDWSSGDPSVVTVSGSGLATSQGTGQTTVSASHEGLTAEASARVIPEIARLEVSAPPDTLREVGETVRLTATAYDGAGDEIPDLDYDWSSSHPSIADVNDTGLVTARRNRGDALITATISGTSASRAVTHIPFGVLALTFDDLHKGAFTDALPLLQGLGIRANLAIPTDWVGKTINGIPRLTEAQIRTLHEAGWSMMPHGTDHADLTGVSDDELHRQLRVSREWVRSRGFEGWNVFVMPYHISNPREREAVTIYYDALRAYGYDHPNHGGMLDWPTDLPYKLTSINASAYFTTAAGRQELLEIWSEAVSKGKFVGTYFHAIGGSDFAAFEQAIELMARFKGHIRTYGDLFGP